LAQFANVFGKYYLYPFCHVFFPIAQLFILPKALIAWQLFLGLW
jgi:hypothetical protein